MSTSLEEQIPNEQDTSQNCESGPPDTHKSVAESLKPAPISMFSRCPIAV